MHVFYIHEISTKYGCRTHAWCLEKKSAISVAGKLFSFGVFVTKSLFHHVGGGRYQYVVFIKFTTGVFMSVVRVNAAECECN
jgi:hypothetical protein